jgi:hypothetical protein
VEQCNRHVRGEVYIEIHAVSRMDRCSGLLYETEYLRLFPAATLVVSSMKHGQSNVEEEAVLFAGDALGQATDFIPS